MLYEGAPEEEFEKVMYADYLKNGNIGIERILYLNNMIKRFLEEIVPTSYAISLAVCDTDYFL